MNTKKRWLTICSTGLFILWLAFAWTQDARVAGGAGTFGGAVPADAAASSLPWGVERIDAPEAWKATTGSSSVVVAVIDSGIDTGVPQLVDRLWTNLGEVPNNGVDDDGNGYVDDVHGWDFRDSDNSALIGSDLHWHGTFVAGIIAAPPESEAVGGVAPGVRIMDVRFLDSKNLFYGGDWKAFTAAVDYAVDNGADIINMSIYADAKPPHSFERALQRAADRGVIIVGISGNRGRDKVCYPGSLSTVLAVSATDQDDRLPYFSNHGEGVAFAAPGEAISSITPGGKAMISSGTSFAAPHVAGTLALILSASPGITPQQALARLAETAVDLGASGHDEQFGAGRIDAGRAVAVSH